MPKKKKKTDMVAHNFCASTGEAETDIYDLGASMGYIASTRTARAAS